MSTAESLCNLALAKLGLRDRVNHLSSPTLPIERHFYTIYPHYRDVELRRYRWVFARKEWTVPQIEGVIADTGLPYSYLVPNDMLAPWRDKNTDWQRIGNELRSGYSGTIKVQGVRRVSEAEFDPLFDEVLACRLALETADYPGVSEAKRADAKDWYKQAVADARQGNAFQRGSDDIQDDDNAFSWLTERAR